MQAWLPHIATSVDGGNQDAFTGWAVLLDILSELSNFSTFETNLSDRSTFQNAPSKQPDEPYEKHCTEMPNMDYALRGLDLPSLNPTFGNDPNDGSGIITEPGIMLPLFEDKGTFISAFEELACTAKAEEDFYGTFEQTVDAWTQMSSSGYNLQVGQELSVEIPVEGVSFGTTIPPMFTRGNSDSEDAGGME